MALIDHGKRAAVLLVAEREERMIQQVHLQNGLVAGHGLHGEGLGADQVELALLRLLGSKGGNGLGRPDKGILPDAAGISRS